jgi:hypothetical protein
VIVLGRRRSGGAAPDRRVGWRELATLLGGELVEGKRASEDKVAVAHGPWKIWLDTYAVNAGENRVTYTRARAFFVGRRDLSLTVRMRNVLDPLLEVLGFGGRRASIPRVLRRSHVVRGKPESRLPSLVMAGAFTDAILAAPKGTLRVRRASRRLRKRYGEDLGVVYYQKTGMVWDAAGLAAMVKVVVEALESLAGVGEARREEVAHRP